MARVNMTAEEDFALEERVAKAISDECARIFREANNFPNVHRLARVAIEEMKKLDRE